MDKAKRQVDRLSSRITQLLESSRAELGKRGYRALAVFPIRENGQIAGTLTVYADREDFFQAKEVALLEEAAGNGSFALDNFLRPALIRRGADLPLLLIMVGVIGGLLAFGVVGLFIGPVVLAVMFTLVKFWIDDGDARA